MIPVAWVTEFSATISATYQFLEELRFRGWDSKDLVRVEIAEDVQCPTWCSGQISISPRHDARSVSHEIAHGFHEKMRERGWKDCFGEDTAEAIRWFVEQRMGASAWCASFRARPTKDDRILELCGYDEMTFKELLITGTLFFRLNWPTHSNG